MKTISLLPAVLLIWGCTHDLDSVSLPCSQDKCPTGFRCVDGRCLPADASTTTDSTPDRPAADQGPDVITDLGLDLPLPDLAGADTGKPDTAKADTKTTDTLLADLPAPDAASPDITTSDAAKPDAALPDASKPDVAQPDAAQPDAAITDAAITDGPCTGCVIANQCYLAQQPSTKYTCSICDPVFSKSRWAPAPGCMLTFAGSIGGTKDGPWNTAQFKIPAGLALDSKGALIVADQYNHCIRKVFQGVVSTVAGVCGSAGKAPAKFDHPTDVAVDSADVIYVADKKNHRIRKIVSGQATTYAGGGFGFKDGAALGVAKFYWPTGLLLTKGTMYVADSNNSTIRTITSGTSGLTVGTLVGIKEKVASGCFNGALGVYHRLHTPQDMVLSSNGDLLVVDSSCPNAIRNIDLLKQTIGTTAGVKGTFSGLTDLVQSSTGTIYVADRPSHRILAVKGTGASAKVTVLVGKAGVGDTEGDIETQAQMYWPTGLALQGDYLYASDGKHSKIRVISLTP